MNFDIPNLKDGELELETPEEAESRIAKQEEYDPYQEMQAIKRQMTLYRGEATLALARDDIAGYQAACIKMGEAFIAECRVKIQLLDADFTRGNFQNRGRSADPEVEASYNDQKRALERDIDHTKHVYIDEVKQDPQAIIRRQGLKVGQGPQNLLEKLSDEVEKLQALDVEERKVSLYRDSADHLEMVILAVLHSKDPELLSLLPGIAKRVTLSPEIQKQISELQ